jgi:nitroimidazol reductase NimA-like FMN-containing flavoprotein (pyridoxamine 5'-phosphate oxidase superfamily)
VTRITPTDRTRLRRAPERGCFDRDEINAILDEAYLCHLAVVDNGQPVVVPTLYGREGDNLIIHGSPASRTMRTARGPMDVAVNVTVVDGIVVARSGFHSSMNFRSVTIYGQAVEITDHEEKHRALTIVLDHVIPGRSRTARPMTDKEVKATMVLRVTLTEASAKVREGWPEDDPEDYELEIWGGVIPISTVFGEPVTDPAQRIEVDVPDHLVGYQRPGGAA